MTGSAALHERAVVVDGEGDPIRTVLTVDDVPAALRSLGDVWLRPHEARGGAR